VIVPRDQRICQHRTTHQGYAPETLSGGSKALRAAAGRGETAAAQDREAR